MEFSASGAVRRHSWVWKLMWLAAGIHLVDALSILLPATFGWLNFARHGRFHALAAATQSAIWFALGTAVRNYRRPRPHTFDR